MKEMKRLDVQQKDVVEEVVEFLIKEWADDFIPELKKELELQDVPNPEGFAYAKKCMRKAFLDQVKEL
jgi:hypothetical protein